MLYIRWGGNNDMVSLCHYISFAIFVAMLGSRNFSSSILKSDYVILDTFV